MKAEDFYTRSKANAGITVPIPLPDETDSEATITIRGIDSDNFKAAKIARSRKNLQILQLPEAEQAAATETADTDLLVSLVAGWSLDTEFTEDNVRALFTEAPHVRDLVNSVAGNRKSFFGKR